MSATISAYSGNYIPTEASVDCRIKAITGHRYVVRDLLITAVWNVDIDTTSDWNMQTITITNGFSSSTSSQAVEPSQTVPVINSTVTSGSNAPQRPNQTQPPSFVYNPFFQLWIGTLITANIAIIVVVILFRRTLKVQTTKPNQQLQ
jgi:hypothetical protein